MSNTQITQFMSLWDKLDENQKLRFVPECRHDDHGEIFRKLVQVVDPIFPSEDHCIVGVHIGAHLYLRLFDSPIPYTASLRPANLSNDLCDAWRSTDYEFIGSISTSSGKHKDIATGQVVWIKTTYGVTLEVYDMMVKLLEKFNTPRKW